MPPHSAFERSSRRRWKRCYLVLHGTKLEIHKPKQTPFFAESRTSDIRPVGWLPGALIESYTLQLAEVGTATDYKKCARAANPHSWSEPYSWRDG